MIGNMNKFCPFEYKQVILESFTFDINNFFIVLCIAYRRKLDVMQQIFKARINMKNLFLDKNFYQKDLAHAIKNFMKVNDIHKYIALRDGL